MLTISAPHPEFAIGKNDAAQPVSDERLASIKQCCYMSMKLICNIESAITPTGKAEAVEAEKNMQLCLNLGDLISILHEVDEARQLSGPIRDLTGDADASVTLVGVTRPPRNKKQKDPHAADGKVSVVVSNHRTNWKPVAFVGETYADALSRAADKYKVVS
jgi:hypothetical protein